MSADRGQSVIRSLSNPQVKQAVRLRSSSTRRKTGRFLIDGLREIELAVAHGISLETVFHAVGTTLPNSIPSTALQSLAPNVLERVSYGQLAGSPVAVAVTPQQSLNGLQIRGKSLVIVLDRTEKPGNLGACVRTASAAGVAAVILTNPICEVFNPNTIRASRGTVFTLPIAICRPAELVTFCQTHKLSIFCAHVDASMTLWDCDLRSGTALVFGNETHGLDDSWLTTGAQAFCIPMPGAADSLNLSISAAVTLYEALRQRKKI